MNEQLQRVREKLRKANLEPGLLDQVAAQSGVSRRTIYNVLREKGSPNLATLDKLDAHFKKADRKAAKQ